MVKCFKGNLFEIKKGGSTLQILSKNRASAIKNFKTRFANKGSGKLKVKLIKGNVEVCR